MTLEASLSLVRELYLISMTHYNVLLLLYTILNYILHSKTLKSRICYFLFYIVILYWFSTYFLIISHYVQNVTLSNMSHLVYITLFGETDGVTLSRLGCSLTTSLVHEESCKGPLRCLGFDVCDPIVSTTSKYYKPFTVQLDYELFYVGSNCKSWRLTSVQLDRELFYVGSNCKPWRLSLNVSVSEFKCKSWKWSKWKISFSSNYRLGPPICVQNRMVFMFWTYLSILSEHSFFWCTLLTTSLDIYHFNIAVRLRRVITKGKWHV